MFRDCLGRARIDQLEAPKMTASLAAPPLSRPSDRALLFDFQAAQNAEKLTFSFRLSSF